MGNGALLKSSVESRPDITSASIISKGKTMEMYGRPDVSMPPEADLKRIFLQVELMVGMITTNERAVGDTRFTMILHASLTVIIVPVKTGKSLGVVFAAFEDVEGLAKRVLEQAALVS